MGIRPSARIFFRSRGGAGLNGAEGSAEPLVAFFAFFVSVAFTGFIAPVPDFFAAAFTARLIAVAV